MKRFCTRVILVILFFSVGLSSFAGNQHEHFHYLMSFQDLRTAHYKVFATRIETLGMKKFMAKKRVIDNLKMIFGETTMNPLLTRFGVKKLANMNLGTISDLIAKLKGITKFEVMAHFFEFGKLTDPARRNDIFSVVESNRTQLFVRMKNDNMERYRRFVIESFKSYLKGTHLHDRKRVVLSTSRSFLDKELISKIREAGRGRGTEFSFLLTVPRGVMRSNQSRFMTLLSEIDVFFQEGLIQGVDIVGSRQETSQIVASKSRIYDLKVKQYYRGISHLMNLITNNAGMVRIHAFERGRAGTFYDALELVFRGMAEKKVQAPMVLSMGHCNAIDRATVDMLKNYAQKISKRYPRSFDLIFDANVLSNHLLHGSVIRDVTANITMLQEAGFKVVLGADGHGIYGQQASYRSTLIALKLRGMSEQALGKLTHNTLKDHYPEGIELRRIEDIVDNVCK